LEAVAEGLLATSTTSVKLRKHKGTHNAKELLSNANSHKLSHSVQRKTKENTHVGEEQRKINGEHGNSQNIEAQEHIISKRSAGTGVSGSVMMLVNVTLLQYLDTGRWFLSVYNDDLRPHQVTLVVAEAEGVSTACPNDCSGHGSCYLGKCDCIDGYEGIDCSKSEYLFLIYYYYYY
jgi:hypothetical protein